MNTTLPPQQQKGFSGQTLKWIAIAAMLVDHIAWLWFPLPSTIGLIMHIIGRITGPIMFYMLAEGMHHTRNKTKYLIRLGIFAVISWPPFFFFMQGSLPSVQSFAPFGVIYTLFLAALAIYAIQKIKNKFLLTLAIVVCIFLSSFGDWPYFGVMIPLAFYAFRGNFKKQAMAYAVVCLLIAGTFVIPLISIYMGRPELQKYLPSVLQNLIMVAGMALPIILLRFYAPQKGGSNKFSKWFFYLFYPAHLLILKLVHMYLSS